MGGSLTPFLRTSHYLGVKTLAGEETQMVRTDVRRGPSGARSAGTLPPAGFCRAHFFQFPNWKKKGAACDGAFFFSRPSYPRCNFRLTSDRPHRARAAAKSDDRCDDRLVNSPAL
jgi:hypothetical protein